MLVRRVTLALAGLVFGALFLGAEPATQVAKSPAGAIAVGQPAPDFELAPLTVETGADSKPVGKIGESKVRLSSFRGKMPVVIILSSYT